MKESAFKICELLILTHNRFNMNQSGLKETGKPRQTYCFCCITEMLISMQEDPH